MIFSSINALDCSYQYPIAIRTALKWIRDHDIAHMNSGIYELQGRDIYINVQDITTQPAESCFPERHDEYIDIQYIVSGVEQMGFIPYTGGETVLQEIPEKDVTIYQNIAGENFIDVPTGSYCIFFTNDIHRPGCASNQPAKVRKAVVKMKQNLL